MEVLNSYTDEFGHIVYETRCIRCNDKIVYRRAIQGDAVCPRCQNKENLNKYYGLKAKKMRDDAINEFYTMVTKRGFTIEEAYAKIMEE